MRDTSHQDLHPGYLCLFLAVIFLTACSPVGITPTSACGDGICDRFEDPQNCPLDCRPATIPTTSPPVITDQPEPTPQIAAQVLSATGAPANTHLPMSPASSSPFGVSGLDSSSGPIPYAQALADTNVRWLRLDGSAKAGWSYQRMRQNGFDFRELDALIRELQNHDFALSLTLSPWVSSPCLQENPDLESYVPADLEGYQDYVRQLVERYDGDGVRDMLGLRYALRLWQLDDAVDLQWAACLEAGFPQSASAQQYFTLYQATYAAIQEVDPEADLWPSFAFSLEPPYTYLDDYLKDFLELLTQAGLPLPQLDLHDHGANRSSTLSAIALIEDLAPGVPIWLGATSLPSGEQVRPRGDFHSFDLQVQARALIGWYLGMLSHPAVEKVFWQPLYDLPPGGEGYDQYGTNGLWSCRPSEGTGESGSICDGYDPKPSQAAYRLLVEKLDGFVSLEEINITTYRARFPDGHVVLVLWTYADPTTLDLREYGLEGQVTVTHLPQISAAGESPLVEQLEAIRVPVSLQPIFVEWQPPE